jgi:hypothetical protein
MKTPKIMSALSKATIELPVQTTTGLQKLCITVDSSDRERILTRQWLAFVNGNTVIPYTDMGTPGKPHMVPLANLVMNVGPDIYVAKLSGNNSNDYRKARLKASR